MSIDLDKLPSSTIFKLANLYDKKRKNSNEKLRMARNPGYRRRETFKLKTKILEKFGNRCGMCGFSDRRALQIDHVNGGGNKGLNAKIGFTFYRKVIADSSGEYQILCANCNLIKYMESIGRYSADVA